jgi:hypothetical protein
MTATLLALTLLAASGAPAQSTSFERIGRCFQSLQGLMPARYPPTDDEMRRMIEMPTRCGWEIVLEKLTPAEAAAVATLQLKFEDGEGPAARVQGNTIYVSFDAIAQAGHVGQVVGHDIFVDDGNPFPVPSRVAYGPLASQPIMGLTNRLSGWIDNAASATACQAVDCKTVQGFALFIGIDAFLLAHEAAHVILPQTSAVADNELAADRWAYALIRRYDADYPDTDVSQLARTAARLAPIFYFDYLRSRLATEQQMAQTTSEIALLERRREQLVSLADKDDRSTLDGLPSSVHTGVGRIVISVEGEVDRSARFWIDGVPMSAADVVGQERVVVAGVRLVAARSSGRFAYVSEVVSAGERQEIRLRFSAPLPSLPSGELEQMARRDQQRGEEKWAQIFLHTTDASGEPRSPAVALLHYQALSMMRLGALIPSAPAGVTDPRTLRNIQRWRERARPLAAWW